MKVKMKIFILMIITLAFASCKKEKSSQSENYSDVPILPETPYDYQKSTNDNLATAGRVLFYDKSLSLNNSVACASCHQQSKAFCDNLQFSTGSQDGKTSRNSPSIFAKSGRMFWDGRAQGINDLVARPIKNHIEMNFDDLASLAKRISGIAYYKTLFQKAYGNSDIDSSMIKNALAEFVKNFNFSSNKFNRSAQHLENLTASEALGKTIFFGKGNCSQCHHIEDPNPTGNGYGFTNNDANIGLDLVYVDKGLGGISQNSFDDGKFMVPVLLNVEFTAPYMHDGRFKTLEEVVEHYNSSIKNHPNLDPNLRDMSSIENLTEPQILQLLDLNHNGFIDQQELESLQPIRLGLTPAEKNSLVDFLKTLSDPSVFLDKKFSNPFKK
jgi:cytochrome c peroxidase